MKKIRRIVTHVARHHRLAETLIHLGAFAAATLTAFLLRFDFNIPGTFVKHVTFAVCAWTSAKIVTFGILRLHRGWWRYASISDVIHLATGNAIGSAAGGAAIYWFGPAGFPRSVYILDFVICFGLTAWIRLLARLAAEFLLSHGRKPAGAAVLIYGAGDAGVMLAKEIRQNAALPYSVAGFVDDDPQKKGARIHGVPVLGTGAELKRIAAEQGAGTVLIAMPSLPGREMKEVLARCLAAKVRYKTMPAMGEVIESRGLLSQVRDVAVEDLLGRDPVRLEVERIRESLTGKVVLVTGAAGSIGSEMCRQIAAFEPGLLVGYEVGETPLFYLEREMRARFPKVPFVAEIGSVQNERRLEEVFAEHRPEVVFHAAAYKHVPMMEAHPFEAVENNVFGTLAVAECAARFGAREFVMISSDKAVRPTSMMGATKRLAELVVRGLQNGGTKFVSVRFGNVLGSNGSVIEIFKQQIAAGGPVTVTHPEMRRYFMTIPEAAQLVLQASTLGQGGEIFVLDMGEAVKISDLAKSLILLSGRVPGQDIEIEYTGMRPGEKLFEELHMVDENTRPTKHEKIQVFGGQSLDGDHVERLLAELRAVCQTRDLGKLVLTIKSVVPDYNVSGEMLEKVIERAAEGGTREMGMAEAG